jgi:hypothetical protein
MKCRWIATLCAAVTFASATPSLATEKFEVVQRGDTELSCTALADEAARMSAIIDNTEQFKKDSEMKSHGISAAGAVGSFLVGTVTGGIGIAAGAFLLDNEVDDQSDRADHIQDVAEERRSFMVGIFNAKGCEGPIMQSSAPAPKAKPMEEPTQMEPSAGDPQAQKAMARLPLRHEKTQSYNN